MDCIFCKIVAGAIPSHKIYEDDATLAFLDINPASRGHALVISKHHAEHIYDMPVDALYAVAQATQRVARRLRQVVQPDGLNVIQNNGAAAGQSVFHYHVHLIPRQRGDRVMQAWKPGATDHAALGALAAELRDAGA